MAWSHPEQSWRNGMDDSQIDNQESKFRTEVNEGIASSLETATDLAGKARTAATEAGSAIQDAAIETGKRVADAAARTYRQGIQTGEYVSQNTAERPLLALLVAGAIGYGIAYMVHRR
jgi:ElaB/YqjD/DUF883 family membrane-anchored ribosome-binding protein